MAPDKRNPAPHEERRGADGDARRAGRSPLRGGSDHTEDQPASANTEPNHCLAAALALNDAGYRVFTVNPARELERSAQHEEKLRGNWALGPWYLVGVWLKNDAAVVCRPTSDGWRTELFPPRRRATRVPPPPADWPRLWREVARVERLLATVPCPRQEENES